MGKFKKRRGDQRPNRPRQVLRGLNIGEMSTVGRPAHEGAVATIIKGYKSADEFDSWLEKQGGNYTGSTRRRRRRDDDEEDDVEKGGDLVRLVTTETDGHQHAIGVSCYDDDLSLYVHYATAGGEEMHSHDHAIVMNADGTYTVTANAGHSHELDQEAVRTAVFDLITKCEDVADVEAVLPLVAKQDHARVAEMIAKSDRFTELPEKGALAAILKEHSASASDPRQPEDTMDPKELQKKNEQLEKQLTVTTAIAGMTDVEKNHYNGIADEDEKSAYLAKSSKDRIAEANAAIEKAKADAGADADPIVYTTIKGRDIRKSDGETVLALAKDADESMREVAKERAVNEKARIEKRAADEFAGLPGDDATHVAVAKALETIKDPELQKKAFEMVKAKAPAMAAATSARGSASSPLRVVGKDASQSEAEAELDRLAKERMKEVAKSGGKAVDFYTAYEQVSNENPELLEKAIGQTTAANRINAG